MKLFRFGQKGAEKPGVIAADGSLRDLSSLVPDIAGGVLAPASLAALRSLDATLLPKVPDGARLGPCVGSVGKMVCVGKNYAEHAKETGAAPPSEPILFMKATSALCGANDAVIIPKGSIKTDWEIELGVVIGTEARYVSEEDAMAHVAGYCIVNDISERAFQLEGTGQFVKGKSADTFGPTGPWLVTADEIADPQALRLTLDLNGKRMQDGTTGDMIFGVRFLIAYISRFMSLQPGDIISTGTPSGVGLGMNPPLYLKPGDVMELAIDGLGTQRQDVVAYGG
jgi:2-keto-4-pentenoate hydratase/2-oxohepta-3-ene-1,7-dioic acid hydratase in catechol pathway